MKGLLRVYDDGDTFKCRLNWATVKDNYLNFYDDKKLQDPSSFINLNGCSIKKIFNASYNVHMIEITTAENNVILITPDNMKDIDKWKDLLVESSTNFRDSYVSQQPTVTPRTPRKIVDMPSTSREPQRNSNPNSNMRLQKNQNALRSSNNVENHYPDRDNIVDHRGRNLHPDNRDSAAGPSNGYRRDSKPIPKKRTSNTPYLSESQRYSQDAPPRPNRDRRESYESYTQGNYGQTPNSNYRKPSAGYNDRRGSNISYTDGNRQSRAIETVKEDPNMSDDEILETKPLEELRRKYPITDKTKRWSIAATDLVGKSNDELFLMLIQLNREKSHMEIWKETLEQYITEIDEKLKERLVMQAVNELESNRTHYVEQLNNIEYLMNLAHPLISFMEAVVQMSDAYGGNNDAFHVVYHETTPTGKEDFSNIHFIRHNQEKQVAKLIQDNKPSTKNSQTLNSLSKDNGSDKENDAEAYLNLDNSEDFLNRKSGLNDIILDICAQLEDLEPSKIEIEKFILNMDKEYDPSIAKNANLPLVTTKGSIKSVKNLKDGEIKSNNSAFMPRRSTRKAPKSDMAPSLQRKDLLKNPGSVGSRSQNASLRYGQYSPKDAKNSLAINPNIGRRSFNVNTASDETDAFYTPVKVAQQSATPRSQKSLTPSNHFSDSIARSNSSKVQNQLRDLMLTDPYEERRPPSPIYRAPSSVLGVPDEESGPLFKLNASLFQNIHGPKRQANNDIKVERKTSLISLSNSDVSAVSNRINQRLHLNQFVDDNKNWKNPGGTVQSPDISDNYPLNDNDTHQKADRLIEDILATPKKVNIGDRYRASIVDEDDIDGVKSKKMRQLIANESFSHLTKTDAGKQQERESMLLNNSRLAQEASRRSRNIQNS